MPKFAANVSTMYHEVPFSERIALAARDGFAAVECQFPYEVSVTELAKRLADANLTLELLNTPPGDFAAGDRGLALDPTRREAFRAAVRKAITYAQASQCPRIHVMAGIPAAQFDAAKVRDTYIQNLAWAAAEIGAAGATALIEPINTRDIPGYYLNHQAKAHAIVRAIGSPHLKVQMDLYHLQIVEGDVAMHIKEFLPNGQVGHIQFAGVPARAEPDGGEINYPYLFELIDSLGYDGWIGCEYFPARNKEIGGTSAGLAWLRARKASENSTQNI
jgi:2-dehydrotetronate isomerase